MNNEVVKDAFAVWNYLSAMYENDPSVDLKKAVDAARNVYDTLVEKVHE